MKTASTNPILTSIYQSSLASDRSANKKGQTVTSNQSDKNLFSLTFSRRTTSNFLIPEIDGLRFIAIFLVLTSHTWGNWPKYSGNDYSGLILSPFEDFMAAALLQGKLGVFLFFAVSGFILALPWLTYLTQEGRRVDVGRYFLRRLTRLEPPYVICMTGYFLALCWLGNLNFSDDLGHLFASLTYTHNLIYGTHSPIYPAAWSLEIEFQFYVLAPLIYPMLFSLPKVARRLGMGAIIFICASLPAAIPDLPDTILYYAHYFITGALLADIYVTDELFSDRRRLEFDLLAVIGFGMLLFTFDKLDTSQTAQIGYAFAIGFLFLGAFNGRLFRAFLTMPVIYLIGGMCYSIYLLHGRVITGIYFYVLEGITLTGGFIYDHLILNATMIPISIFVAAVFFLLIERPSMDPNWPAKILARFRCFGNS